MKKIKKRFLSTVISLSFVPLFSVSAAGFDKYPAFVDIDGHWAQSEIEYLYNAELVSGVSETEFAPDEIIDKAQFITMLVRALGIEPDIYSISYSDVAPVSDWFAGYLGAAVNAGIIENSVFAFNPEETVSRVDAARMLNSAIEYEGLTDEASYKLVEYSDISTQNDILHTAVSNVSALGIMVGQTENEFVPEKNLTRAEAAAVVKRFSLAAGSAGKIAIPAIASEVNSASVDGDIISFNGDYSYAAIDAVDFHYDINQIEVSAAAAGSDLQLEIWIDSLDTLSGTKIGTVLLEASGAAYQTKTADIARTYGVHKLYLRLVGAGNASVKDIALKTNSVDLNLSKYSRIYNMKRSGSTITNINYGGYIDFDGLALGNGYDTIELSMTNSTPGQLFEIWLNNEKVSVVETLASGDEGVTVKTPIVKAENTKNLSIKPLTDIDGTITGIRFYNTTSKADLLLSADKADTNLEISKSADYDGGNQTEVIKDGDVIKFSNVNFSDGYNVLSMRMQDSGLKKLSVPMTEDGVETGYMMGIFTSDDSAHLEVRLDSEDGLLVGTIEKNAVMTNSDYDIQSCYLYKASGLHDLYLKAVGDLGWNLCYIKLQERGWYDSPFATLEAEDMEINLGTAADPNDISRYELHSITAEASGKNAVRIEKNGGYVEFRVPEWYSASADSTALTVRHSIPDRIDENTSYSLGQDGKMKVTVNGKEVKILNSFEHFKAEEALTLSSKNTKGYNGTWGNAPNSINNSTYGGFYFNDAYGVLEGDIKPGDVIRLIPEINENIEYCYIDSVDIEAIPEKKEKPDGFLSITDCGAVPNDGADDGEALRRAAQTVREDPYTYKGVWIPEGLFDIKTYVGNKVSLAADFSGMRVLGAGMWHSKIITHLGTWTKWSANYITSENTVIRDVALHGTTIARGWENNGNTLGAIGISGSGANFIENVWFEHWNAGIWLHDGSGVYYKNRIKNTWADGINIHDSGYGIVYKKNFFRATGDDALAIFSSCASAINMTKEVEINNNTVVGVWHASGITIWGGEDIDIFNNLVCDTSSSSGIGLKSWGWNAPATDNVWIKNNRIERCGNINEGNQYNAAIEIVPGYHSDDYNSVYKNTYIENNECIDNPSLFMRISSQRNADEVFVTVRYNYIRNTCLAFPDKRRIIDYRTPDVRGRTTYAYNVLEGEFNKFKSSNTTGMTDNCLGNLPDNWGQ